MDDSYVNDVCKIGQGSDCCRYLMMGSGGFECAKASAMMRNAIDARASRMTAKGDNCSGFTGGAQ